MICSGGHDICTCTRTYVISCIYVCTAYPVSCICSMYIAYIHQHADVDMSWAEHDLVARSHDQLIWHLDPPKPLKSCFSTYAKTRILGILGISPCSWGLESPVSRDPWNMGNRGKYTTMGRYREVLKPPILGDFGPPRSWSETWFSCCQVMKSAAEIMIFHGFRGWYPGMHEIPGILNTCI